MASATAVCGARPPKRPRRRHGRMISSPVYAACVAPDRCQRPAQARHPDLSRQPPFEFEAGQAHRAGGLLERVEARDGHAHRARTSTPRALFRRQARGRCAAAGSADRAGAGDRSAEPRRHTASPSSRRRACAKTCGSCSEDAEFGALEHPTASTRTTRISPKSGARYLVDQGVKVVGVDYLSVEQFKKAGAPAHRALLGNGVIIIEGLDLSDAEPGHVRDVLPAAAHRKARTARPPASCSSGEDGTCWTMLSSWCWPAASASASTR